MWTTVPAHYQMHFENAYFGTGPVCVVAEIRLCSVDATKRYPIYFCNAWLKQRDRVSGRFLSVVIMKKVHVRAVFAKLNEMIFGCPLKAMSKGEGVFPVYNRLSPYMNGKIRLERPLVDFWRATKAPVRFEVIDHDHLYDSVGKQLFTRRPTFSYTEKEEEDFASEEEESDLSSSEEEEEEEILPEEFSDEEEEDVQIVLPVVRQRQASPQPTFVVPQPPLPVPRTKPAFVFPSPHPLFTRQPDSPVFQKKSFDMEGASFDEIVEELCNFLPEEMCEEDEVDFDTLATDLDWESWRMPVQDPGVNLGIFS